MAREQEGFEPLGYYNGILESAAGDGKGVTGDLLASTPAGDTQPTKWSTDIDMARPADTSYAAFAQQEQTKASTARNIASVFLNMPDNADLIFNRDPYSAMSTEQRKQLTSISKDSGLSTSALRTALADRAMEINTASPDAGDRPMMGPDLAQLGPADPAPTYGELMRMSLDDPLGGRGPTARQYVPARDRPPKHLFGAGGLIEGQQGPLPDPGKYPGLDEGRFTGVNIETYPQPPIDVVTGGRPQQRVDTLPSGIIGGPTWERPPIDYVSKLPTDVGPNVLGLRRELDPVPSFGSPGVADPMARTSTGERVGPRTFTPTGVPPASVARFSIDPSLLTRTGEVFERPQLTSQYTEAAQKLYGPTPTRKGAGGEIRDVYGTPVTGVSSPPGQLTMEQIRAMSLGEPMPPPQVIPGPSQPQAEPLAGVNENLKSRIFADSQDVKGNFYSFTAANKAEAQGLGSPSVSSRPVDDVYDLMDQILGHLTDPNNKLDYTDVPDEELRQHAFLLAEEWTRAAEEIDPAVYFLDRGTEIERADQKAALKRGTAPTQPATTTGVPSAVAEDGVTPTVTAPGAAAPTATTDMTVPGAAVPTTPTDTTAAATTAAAPTPDAAGTTPDASSFQPLAFNMLGDLPDDPAMLNADDPYFSIATSRVYDTVSRQVLGGRAFLPSVARKLQNMEDTNFGNYLLQQQLDPSGFTSPDRLTYADWLAKGFASSADEFFDPDQQNRGWDALVAASLDFGSPEPMEGTHEWAARQLALSDEHSRAAAMAQAGIRRGGYGHNQLKELAFERLYDRYSDSQLVASDDEKVGFAGWLSKQEGTVWYRPPTIDKAAAFAPPSESYQQEPLVSRGQITQEAGTADILARNQAAWQERQARPPSFGMETGAGTAGITADQQAAWQERQAQTPSYQGLQRPLDLKPLEPLDYDPYVGDIVPPSAARAVPYIPGGFQPTPIGGLTTPLIDPIKLIPGVGGTAFNLPMPIGETGTAIPLGMTSPAPVPSIRSEADMARAYAGITDFPYAQPGASQMMLEEAERLRNQPVVSYGGRPPSQWVG